MSIIHETQGNLAFAIKWMDFEDIMLRKISNRDKYYMIPLICRILKVELVKAENKMVVTRERLWCWEGLGARGEGDDRGWYGWVASLTRWTWVSVNSRSWWWTGRPGVLQFMGLQRVGHDWETDLIWSES